MVANIVYDYTRCDRCGLNCAKGAPNPKLTYIIEPRALRGIAICFGTNYKGAMSNKSGLKITAADGKFSLHIHGSGTYQIVFRQGEEPEVSEGEPHICPKAPTPRADSKSNA